MITLFKRKKESPAYVICFKRTATLCVPYYYVEGEKESWKEAPQRGFFYYDPIEDTPQYKKICTKVDKLVDRKTKSAAGKLGSCHYVWGMRKKILKKRYGIDWHTPSEMNPGCCFD